MQKVGTVMRRRWLAVSPEASVRETLQLMRMARLRALPVVADGILRGTLPYPVLVEAALAGRPSRVGEVMHPETEACEPTMTVAEAADRIARARAGCLSIVERSPEGPRMVGLVTESDLLRLAYEPARAPAPV